LRHVVGLGLEVLQAAVETTQLLRDAPGGGQGRRRLPEGADRPAAVVAAGEAPEGPLDGGHELLAVAEQVPPLAESLLLPCLQLRPLQLTDLELEAVHPPGLLRLVHLEGA